MKITGKIIALLTGVALLIALGVGIAFWSFLEIETSADARSRASNVISRAKKMLSVLKDAEAGKRGYLRAGDEEFLNPYFIMRDGIKGQLEELRQNALTDGSRQKLEKLTPLIDDKLAEMARDIEFRRNQDMSAVMAVAGENQGKKLMDSIRPNGTKLEKVFIQKEQRLPESQENKESAGDRQELKVICDKLEDLLAVDNVAAKDILYENADLLKAAFPQHYQKLAFGIRSFDFDTARIILRESIRST